MVVWTKELYEQELGNLILRILMVLIEACVDCVESIVNAHLGGK